MSKDLEQAYKDVIASQQALITELQEYSNYLKGFSEEVSDDRLKAILAKGSNE